MSGITNLNFMQSMTDVIRAQWVVMELLACGDDRRVEIAEERVARCVPRLVKAALTLDRVLSEPGDEDRRRRLVEGALRLTAEDGTVGPVTGFCYLTFRDARVSSCVLNLEGSRLGREQSSSFGVSFGKRSLRSFGGEGA